MNRPWKLESSSTSAVILKQCNHLVDNLDIGKTATLRFANEFGIAPALGNEVVYVEHGEGLCSSCVCRLFLSELHRKLRRCNFWNQKKRKIRSKAKVKLSLSVESQNKNGGVRKVGSDSFARPWP